MIFNEVLCYKIFRFVGSTQESDKVGILGGFPKNEELGTRGCHALRFEQQIAEVGVAATAA